MAKEALILHSCYHCLTPWWDEQVRPSGLVWLFGELSRHAGVRAQFPNRSTAPTRTR